MKLTLPRRCAGYRPWWTVRLWMIQKLLQCNTHIRDRVTSHCCLCDMLYLQPICLDKIWNTAWIIDGFQVVSKRKKDGRASPKGWNLSAVTKFRSSPLGSLWWLTKLGAFGKKKMGKRPRQRLSPVQRSDLTISYALTFHLKYRIIRSI